MNKRSWTFIIVIIILMVALNSCDFSPLKRNEPAYTFGCFVYRIYKEAGIEKVRIIDVSYENELSELNYVMFPEVIDGKKVGYIGDYHELGDGLQRQYFKYSFYMIDKVFIPVGIIVNCKFRKNSSLKLFWLDGENTPSPIIDEIYVPFGRHAEYKLPVITSLVLKKANISFKYNFEEAIEEPNYGYYWIDHLDEGEKLEVFPDNPIREGYTFEGWYSERECKNRADLNTFIKENVEEETIFYAKWIEKE